MQLGTRISCLMSRRLKQAVLAFVVVIAIAQLVRPERTNPLTDSTRTIQAQLKTSRELVAVLDRGCGDCHSNETTWPWFTQVAPLSWLMAYTVREGRNVMNFSEWGAYSPEHQRALLSASCRDVSEGTMPGVYTLLRPDTKLTKNDIAMICAAGASR